MISYIMLDDVLDIGKNQNLNSRGSSESLGII